jgi:hypothetical protein
MGIFDITPSIRLDTEAFNNALKELNLSKAEFNSQLRKAGVSLSNQRSKTNYLNKLLKDAGLGTSYKNVISSKPSEVLTKKGTVEVGMGGERPGQRGAPNNAKIWSDGTKVQKKAEKLFKTVKEQRKYFVDTMQKVYKNIPKKQILELFKNVVKGIKTASPMGMMQELAIDMLEQNPELLSIMPGNPNAQPLTYNKGGMMNINEMIKPIGYAEGGFENRMEMLKDSMRDDENKRMVQPDVTSVALKIAQQQGDTSEANINKIIRQLMAMVPSVNQTMKDELTPTMNKGITGLLDKIGVMFGQKSDPKLNRNVGFSRVR